MAELLERFLAGEPSAWAEVQDVVSRVVRFDGYYVPTAETPELIQEVLQHVWTAAREPGFEVRRDFRSFARKIALCRCIEWVRRQARRPKEVEFHAPAMAFASDATAERRIVDRERLSLVEQVLAKLQPSCLTLIQLVVVERKKYEEVAEIDGRSVEAVRRHWCDCLKTCRRLREEIESALAPPKLRRR